MQSLLKEEEVNVQQHGKFLLTMNQSNFAFEANPPHEKNQDQKLSAWEDWTCNENARNSRGNLPRLFLLLVLLFKHLLEQKPDPFFNGCLDTSTGMSPSNCQAPGFPGYFSGAIATCIKTHVHEAPGSQPLWWYLQGCPGKTVRLLML